MKVGLRSFFVCVESGGRERESERERKRVKEGEREMKKLTDRRRETETKTDKQRGERKK